MSVLLPPDYVPYRFLSAALSTGLSETFHPGFPVILTNFIAGWSGSVIEIGVEVTLNSADLFLGRVDAAFNSYSASIQCWVPMVAGDALQVQAGPHSACGFALSGWQCPLAHL